MKRMRLLVAVLPLALMAVVPALAQTSPPVIVSSVGYINGTPLTAHTSTAFNSTRCLHPGGLRLHQYPLERPAGKYQWPE